MNSKKSATVTEASMTILFQFFKGILPLRDNEKEAFRLRMRERTLRRKQQILQEGDVCRHYTFVIRGCFRMYNVDSKGVEHNIQFVAENDWISDIGSFYSNKPSQLNIEAIEPSQVLQIEKDDLTFLYTHFSRINRNFRVIIENKFVELQNRVLGEISSTAYERYTNFLALYPNLSSRLSATQIASYLGVTPEFLSKIRKGVYGKK